MSSKKGQISGKNGPCAGNRPNNPLCKAVGYGETFDLDKHPQGTEVKAITYSAMQIREAPNFCEVFVIIDI